jgi:hypothetical protein
LAVSWPFSVFGGGIALATFPLTIVAVNLRRRSVIIQVQQTYSKLLSSIPSMFESEPAESTNGDDEPRISLQNLKALTDMAVFGHSLCTATAAIQATDSPQLCTSGRLPVMSPEAMSTVDENDLRTRNDDFDGGNGNDMPQRDASVAEPPAQACLGCGAKDTPEWRRGPLGPRTLCNACVSQGDDGTVALLSFRLTSSRHFFQ